MLKYVRTYALYDCPLLQPHSKMQPTCTKYMYVCTYVCKLRYNPPICTYALLQGPSLLVAYVYMTFLTTHSVWTQNLFIHWEAELNIAHCTSFKQSIDSPLAIATLPKTWSCTYIKWCSELVPFTLLSLHHDVTVWSKLCWLSSSGWRKLWKPFTIWMHHRVWSDLVKVLTWHIRTYTCLRSGRSLDWPRKLWIHRFHRTIIYGLPWSITCIITYTYIHTFLHTYIHVHVHVPIKYVRMYVHVHARTYVAFAFYSPVYTTLSSWFPGCLELMCVNTTDLDWSSIHLMHVGLTSSSLGTGLKV